MPILKNSYTSKDYWNLPDGQRAELINGQFYNMAPPSRIHQEISYQISRLLGNYIESNGGKCRVYPAPFAVNLDADDKDWVEPDISVICDPNKLTDRSRSHFRNCISIQPTHGLQYQKRTVCTVWHP